MQTRTAQDVRNYNTHDVIIMCLRGDCVLCSQAEIVLTLFNSVFVRACLRACELLAHVIYSSLKGNCLYGFGPEKKVIELADQRISLKNGETL